MSAKYIVIRTREFREFLTPEQQGQFASILETITAKRREKNPGKADPMFFTLNALDKYAPEAIEAYMHAIDEDETNSHNEGVKDARRAAWDFRRYGVLYNTDKLPS